MMHPEIEQVVKLVKESGIADEILLLTNGMINTDIYLELIEKHGLKPENSNKLNKPPHHTLLMTVAPIDLNLFGVKPLKSCDILKRCGLGYSEMGYYPCCLSAAIGRVFNIKGANSWLELDNMYHELLDKTCRYCGYYLTSKCDTILSEFEYPKGMMTESWKEATRRYNAK